MRKTTVINLFGGPGCGKSTTAPLVYGMLKQKGANAELVQEFVKGWAWGGRKIGPLDQLYILGKQSQLESTLYGKVDYIVTDSPLILAGVYQEHYHGYTYVKQAALEFVRHAEGLGVSYLNFNLKRNFPYDPKGRWETEDEAKLIDLAILKHVQEVFSLSFIKTVCGPEDVLAHIGSMALSLNNLREK